MSINSGERGVACTKCFYCLESGSIVMNTRFSTSLAKKVESWHNKVLDRVPCSKCADLMKIGIILIGVDDEKSDTNWHVNPYNKNDFHGKEEENPYYHWLPNPYRTGHFFVVKEEFIHRELNSMQEQLIKSRWSFISEDTIKLLGLDKHLAEGVNDAKNN